MRHTLEQGLNCFPVEYCHTWLEQFATDDIYSGQCLNSLTPDEELAGFLSARGNCLEANARYTEARQTYAGAHRLAPNTTLYVALLNRAVKKQSSDSAKPGLALGSGPKPPSIRLTP